MLEQVKDGRLDFAVIRSDAVDEPLAGMAIGAMDFKWLVPRSFLPGKSAAGVELS